MFKLKSLEAKNFLCFKELSLDFTKPGLYLITGYNEKGGDSNGSGKSAIFNAISFALFGKTANGLRDLNEIGRWNVSGDWKVVLCLVDESGQEYEIDRGNKGFDFKIGGNPIGGHKRDLQETINDTFRTSYDLFISINLFTQHSEFLTNMGDAEKKRLFKSILGLDKLDEIADRLSKLYVELQTRYDDLGGMIVVETSIIDSLSTQLESAKSRQQQFEVERSKRLSDLEKKIADIKPVLEEVNLDPYALDLMYASTKSQEAKVREETVRSALQNAYTDMEVARKEIERLSDVRSTSENSRGLLCEFCGSKINRKNLAKHLEELEKQIELCQSEEKNNYYLTVQYENELESIRNIYKVEEKVRQKYREMEQSQLAFAAEQSQIGKVKETIQEEINLLRNSVNTYNFMVQDMTIKISDAERKRKLQEAERKKVSSTIDIYGFLKWVLSKEGVASYIIERSFGRLESLANMYLGRICSERFTVEIRPQRELKSKALKEEINITVTTEGKRIPYASLSGGQRQRLNIALLLSLYRLCRDNGVSSFNFLLLDEILDLSLGVKGQEDIIRLLHQVRDEIFHIFVISHKEGISNDFEFEIQVRREKDGISKLVSI